jgi:hypothetical protein
LVAAIVCSAANCYGITFAKWWLSASSSRFHGYRNRDAGGHTFTACESDSTTTTSCLTTTWVLSQECLSIDKTSLENF